MRAKNDVERVVLGLGGAAVAFAVTAFPSRTAVAAENVFLRKQLAPYRERQAQGTT